MMTATSTVTDGCPPTHHPFLHTHPHALPHACTSTTHAHHTPACLHTIPPAHSPVFMPIHPHTQPHPQPPAPASVRRSSPRTAKRPRTGPDRTDLGPDRSPGPASVLNGPVLVLNFSGKLRTSPGPVQTGLLPLFNRGSN